MATLDFTENYEDKIIAALPTQKGHGPDLEIKGIPVSDFEELFGFQVDNYNGWEQDWGANFEYNGRSYYIYGSAYYASATIVLES
jgi:hypothetical protein